MAGYIVNPAGATHQVSDVSPGTNEKGERIPSHYEELLGTQGYRKATAAERADWWKSQGLEVPREPKDESGQEPA